MYEIEVKGKKFWRILRCSLDEQEEESFPQQRMTTDSCAERYGIDITYTKEFAGHSATSGDQVGPILELIDKKIDGADVDGFILDAYARFARSDVDEAQLYAACRNANLLILTDKEGLMMGPGTWAKRGATTDQNEGYARDVGRHLSRSIIKMILEGTIPPQLAFPWAMDREYYDPNGKATFRVRRLQDGRRAVLDPEPPHNVRFHMPRGNTRLGLLEKGHSFKWVPGDKALTDVAQEFFRRHYIGKERVHPLCAELNQRKVPTKGGGKWTTQTLRKILDGPLWIGLSVAFRWTSGSHLERGKNGPQMFPIPKRKGYRKNSRKLRKVMLPKSNKFFPYQQRRHRFIERHVRLHGR
jgi:hypothetical protein